MAYIWFLFISISNVPLPENSATEDTGKNLLFCLNIKITLSTITPHQSAPNAPNICAT